MIDFRSDTVTKPTKQMCEAMANAVVGDDVYGDDPTINELEALAATMTGFEASVFVPSGTMGNQLSIFTHTNRGDEIIVGRKSHIKNYEVGAAAVISGVSYHLINEVKGMMPLEEIEAGIRGMDIHYPNTSLICVENAHGTGVVLPLDYLQKLRKLADKHQLKIHMDGARLFNAATYLGVDVTEITQYVDSVTFCLSKGLASPIGSLICGSKEFIYRARKGRKLLGGGMRQVGILGAAGLISLREMTKRLHIDHKHARYLGEELDKLPEFHVDFDRLQINMVFVRSSLDLTKLAEYLKQYDILIGGYKGDVVRIAIHNDIEKADIDALLSRIKDYVKEVNNA
ncbi:low-specificity L-threonine aldolase [Candidatus Xianfuyuplasma coldseepsis]|uniref:Low-specificity L-threonine aldolase n=1 Tax=Candidatus Xianfuyuplasma coldseepsis TaxID=2782163 RepID=A0A7L7KUU6_9MOLU|nr:low-specificity L-threonine aldolase [Xianfuyuplasma coldseepsis]QMS85774.1 low-specificity L-threonine aldolase [Xianfuyuplasma coldseepsis]